MGHGSPPTGSCCSRGEGHHYLCGPKISGPGRKQIFHTDTLSGDVTLQDDGRQRVTPPPMAHTKSHSGRVPADRQSQPLKVPSPQLTETMKNADAEVSAAIISTVQDGYGMVGNPIAPPPGGHRGS